MGLTAKRQIEDFKTKQFDKYKKQILDLSSPNVEVEVDWSTVGKPDEDMEHLIAETTGKIYFEPVIQAFKAVGVDQMGKDALKDSVKKVVIKNSADSTNYEYFTFENGVLTIDHRPVYNVDDLNERTEYVTELLIKNL